MSDSLDSSEQAEDACSVVESGENRARGRDACAESPANKILDLYAYSKQQYIQGIAIGPKDK